MSGLTRACGPAAGWNRWWWTNYICPTAYRGPNGSRLLLGFFKYGRVPVHDQQSSAKPCGARSQSGATPSPASQTTRRKSEPKKRQGKDKGKRHSREGPGPSSLSTSFVSAAHIHLLPTFPWSRGDRHHLPHLHVLKEGTAMSTLTRGRIFHFFSQYASGRHWYCFFGGKPGRCHVTKSSDSTGLIEPLDRWIQLSIFFKSNHSAEVSLALKR